MKGRTGSRGLPRDPWELGFLGVITVNMKSSDDPTLDLTSIEQLVCNIPRLVEAIWRRDGAPRWEM